MYSSCSMCIFGLVCLLAFSCGEQEGLEPADFENSGPVVRMWNEAGDEMTQAGTEPNLTDPEMLQAGTEMTQAGTETSSAGTEVTSAGTEMTSAGTEMTSAGTEVLQAGTEMEFLALEYITINEIVAQDSEENTDWLEFANQSDQDIDLRGWVIEDAGQNTIMFAPDTIVPAHGYLRLVQGVDFMFDLGLDDQLSLKTPMGELVDYTEWNENQISSTSSWARVPDMIGEFQATNQITPNARNLASLETSVACGDLICDESENCQNCAEDCGACQECPDQLFISEYVEGSQSNKAIELFNGTGQDINLNEYQVWNITNGGFWSETVTELEGILAHGETKVICNQNIDAMYASLCNDFYGTNPVNFNGDDAIGLARLIDGEFVLVDQIGDESADIDRGWEVSGITFATQNHTLVRKGSAYASLNWVGSASQDWLVYDQDTMDYLGTHSLDNPNCQ